MRRRYDVLIIGAGVVGSAIARELTRYRLDICVLEKNADVCCGVSGRNTGLLHAGFLYPKGSLKTRFTLEGNRGFDQLAKELDIPFKRTGKLTVGHTPQEYDRLLSLKARGEENGVTGLEMIDKAQLRQIDPHVKGEFALYSKTSGLLNPYLYTIALAENAKQNGGEFIFDCEVLSAGQASGGDHCLNTTKGEFCGRWVINAAGLHSAAVAAMLKVPDFQLKWIKGEYILLDKKAGAHLSLPVYPAPDENDVYDIHITPTLDGNVLIGPTCDEVVEEADFDTSRAGLDQLLQKGGLLFDGMRPGWQIRNFSGIFSRPVDPKTGAELDFQIDYRDTVPRVIQVVGITSPGLTCSYPIARYVAGIFLRQETPGINRDFHPIRKGITPFAEQDDETRSRLVALDPDYGEIVCRCEQITRGEILKAIHNPLGVCSVNGIKYRTRASMGRCQGGYCETRITEMIRKETGAAVTDVRLDGPESYMFTGKVR